MLLSGPPSKKPKQALKEAELKKAQGNVIVQFQSAAGDTTGPQLDLPSNVTPTQLEVLLNGLLTNEEKLPYSFYIEEQELAGELGDHLSKNAVSVEKALNVVYQPQGHRNWVLVVSWSPDAKYIVSGDMDGNLWLWNPKTGEPFGQCQGHKKWITSIAWEPAHKATPCARFVTGSRDNNIRVWNAMTRQCIFSMSNHTMVITAVKWGGEGLIYSSSRDCSISVWDTTDGKLVRILKGYDHKNKPISVWDATDGKLVRILKGHGHWVNSLALSTEHVLRTGAFDHHGVAPSDPVEHKAQALTRYKQATEGQAERMVSGSDGFTMFLWILWYNEATKGQAERMVSGSDDFTMFLWKPSESKQHIARMTGHVQLINQVQFSPDGRWILSASFDKSIKLWDGEKGTFAATFRSHVGPVYQCAWSSDSRLFVSGSKDSTLKVWDVRTRKLKVDLPGHADEVFTVDWAPDGSGVASGGKDKVLKLWRQ
eukprot:gene15895-22029_t